MLEPLYLNSERAGKIFPNMKNARFTKFRDEFINLWRDGYYPRETYIKECNAVELRAFVHYLSWREYFQDKNLIKEIELFRG